MSERLISNKLKNTHKDVLKFSCATNIDMSSVVHMEANGFYEKLDVQLYGSDVWKKNNQFHVKKNGGSQGHHDDIANGDENEHNYYIVSLIGNKFKTEDIYAKEEEKDENRLDNRYWAVCVYKKSTDFLNLSEQEYHNISPLIPLYNNKYVHPGVYSTVRKDIFGNRIVSMSAPSILSSMSIRESIMNKRRGKK